MNGVLAAAGFQVLLTGLWAPVVTIRREHDGAFKFKDQRIVPCQVTRDTDTRYSESLPAQRSAIDALLPLCCRIYFPCWHDVAASVRDRSHSIIPTSTSIIPFFFLHRSPASALVASLSQYHDSRIPVASTCISCNLRNNASYSC